MGAPAPTTGGDLPKSEISWDDCRDFLDVVNRRKDEPLLAVARLALPTESQWEHAARSAHKGLWSFGDDPKALSRFAWYRVNSDMKLQPVGKRQATDRGFFDLHGNVSEWCADWYTGGPAGGEDPEGPAHGTHRVVRGGNIADPVDGTKTARRLDVKPSAKRLEIGLRVALVLRNP